MILYIHRRVKILCRTTTVSILRDERADRIVYTEEREISDERGGGVGHRHEYGVPLGEGLPTSAHHAQLHSTLGTMRSVAYGLQHKQANIA